MQLQTIVPINQLTNKINYHSKIVSVGSCFAVNIAQKLTQFQFQNSVNPWGILFHPVAIEKLINAAVNDTVFTTEDVFCANEIWSCFDTHSDLNALDAESIVEDINKKTAIFKQNLQQASHFVITLGTAWVYRFNKTNKIVANCHKIPQANFTKQLLSVQNCVSALQNITQNIKQINPNIQLIYTVSPVRHIKDGFVENQRSKAHLITALHEYLCQNNQAYYFPSYEIMMDELRDYRFYNADLLHPNHIAIDYIWERFTENCIHPEMYQTMKKVDEVQKGLAHKPFNPYADAHQLFLDKLALKLDDLLEKYPFMNFR